MATNTVADSTGDTPSPIIPGQPLQHEAGEEEDDGDSCRICRYPGSTEDPLRYLCACRGSIRFVHEQCLLQWLNRRNLRSCEICKHTFSFTPIYAESTPAKLSFRELVLLASAKTISFLQLFIRFCFVAFAWIFLLPFITFRIWLFTLARSLSDSTKLFSGHLFTPVKIFTDSLLGILLIIGVAVVTVVGAHLLEYLMHLVNRGPDDHEMVNQNGRQRMNWPFGARGGDHGAHDIGAENRGQQMNGHYAAPLAAWVEAVGMAVRNQRFEKFVGMEGPLHDLLKNWMLVLAINLALLGILSFVSFSLGRIVFYCLSFSSSSFLQYKQLTAVLTYDVSNTKFVERPNQLDLSAILVGYTSILAPIIIYIGFKNAKAVIGCIKRLFLSFGALSLDGLKDLIENFKVPLVCLVEVVVFPFIFGWWIDVCSLELVGCSIDLRLRNFGSDPVRSICVHLCLGLVYVFLLNSFIEDVQEVLNNRVVDFLFTIVPQGPELFHILQARPASDHVFRLLLIFGIYGSSIVTVIYIPIQLIMKLDLASSIFPLNFAVEAAHAYGLLFMVCMPTIMRNFKYPRSTIRAFLRYWFAIVGQALNLTNTLLPTDVADNVLVNRKGASSRQDSEPDLHGSLDAGGVNKLDNQADHKYNFLFGVTLLLALAWISLLLFSTAMIVLPSFIGRVVFDAIPHPPALDAIWECDLFALFLGLYILWRWIVIARSLVSSLGNRDLFSVVSKTWKWCTTDLKNMLFYSIWMFGIPLLVGLLLDALFLPVKANVNESLLVHDLQLYWTEGAIIVRLSALYISQGQLNNDNSFIANVVRMELHQGHFRGTSALTEVIIPVFSHLLTALCFPHVLAKLILPLMGFPHLVHYVWLGFLDLCVARILAKMTPFWITKFNDYMKDDRHLIEGRLNNYGGELHVT